jgi:asparagine synthetase B (glutamine-hydrolysing)
MCGFVISNKKGIVRESLLRQRHRGPDGVSMWSGGGIEMGHVLLDINGSNTIQPYTTKKGNILVFNGEMYNCPIKNDTEWLGEGMDRYGLRFLEYNNWHGSVAYFDRKKNE